MTFALRHPHAGYFAYIHPKKGMQFTRDQSKADFFPDRAAALAAWRQAAESARASYVEAWKDEPAERQLARLKRTERYWYDQHKSRPDVAAAPMIAAMPSWLLFEGDPPLFEIPDASALTEQVSLFMARSRGKWIVSHNNGEGLTLSDSCDKAPCFLSIEAAEHYLRRHRYSFGDVVFVEFAAFAKAATPSGAASLGEFEQGLNARAQGREIRLSLEPATQEAAATKRRSAL